MKNTMFIVGLALMVAGVGFGIWAGVWWAFVGGIVEVVTQLKAANFDGAAMGLGLLRFLCAGPIGWISGILAVIPGLSIAKANC